MRDQQGFTDFATARAGDLRRQAYLLTGSPDRAVRLADKALAETAALLVLSKKLSAIFHEGEDA